MGLDWDEIEFEYSTLDALPPEGESEMADSELGRHLMARAKELRARGHEEDALHAESCARRIFARG